MKNDWHPGRNEAIPQVELLSQEVAAIRSLHGQLSARLVVSERQNPVNLQEKSP
jgi:hypothetical protein